MAVQKKTGPDKTGKKKSSSFMQQISPEEATIARERVTLRIFQPTATRPPSEFFPNPELITILDQGREGTTVGMSIAAALDYLHAEQGRKLLFSPRMIYETAKIYDEWPGTDHEGTSLVGGIAGLMNKGVCPEMDWPYSQKEPAPGAFDSALEYIPSAVMRVSPNVDHLRSAIFEHHAVIVSAQIHDGWTKTKNGIISFSTPESSKIMGGHTFVLLGYTQQGFIIQNSWGKAWSSLLVNKQKIPGLALWTYDDATANLNDAWVVSLSSPIYRSPLAGYDADSLEGEDLLNIKTEVKAFSYVLASRATAPPLALGLFGDWGSGKSFFLQEMQKEISSLAEMSQSHVDKGAAETAFCNNIVQINFNAWHYLDADLWASLVTEIFDKIFESVGGGQKDKPEKKLPQLATELKNANGVYQQAQKQLTDAETARDTAEQNLKTAVTNREEKENSLHIQLDDLSTLLINNDDIRTNIERLAKDLGIPEIVKSYQTLCTQANAIQGTGRRFSVLMQTVFNASMEGKRFFLLLGAIFSPVLLVGFVELLQHSFNEQFQSLQSVSLQISTLLASITGWLGAQIKRGAKILTCLEETHRQLEKLHQANRAAIISKEESELQALIDREKVARESVFDAELHVQTLQREIQELQPKKLIMRFIEERSASSDYRSKLGIVSLVRRDFERLSELADPESKGHDSSLMPVQRIILYIDDLDRCSPERVIEVLEAVHLLLAFRLFMVVVAVDPRWLRRCLEKQYPELLISETQDLAAIAHIVTSRPATAQDYLEKIFQIPFALQPISADGYRNLIRGLTERNRPQDMTVAPLAEKAFTQDDHRQGETDAKEGQVQQEQKSTRIADMSAMKKKAREELRSILKSEENYERESSAIEQLQFRSWELRDMERLAPLFHTPRSVKRFVNTYRFLRATIRPQYLLRYEGTESSPGVYRAAMALLSIVISQANIAPRFLKRIMDNVHEEPENKEWVEFLHHARAEVASNNSRDEEKLKTEVNSARANDDTTKSPHPEAKQKLTNWEELEWVQLCDNLITISDGSFPVKNTEEMDEWIYLVSRFSFSLASMATLKSKSNPVVKQS